MAHCSAKKNVAAGNLVAVILTVAASLTGSLSESQAGRRPRFKHHYEGIAIAIHERCGLKFWKTSTRRQYAQLKASSANRLVRQAFSSAET